jgi:hypothetical protein
MQRMAWKQQLDAAVSHIQAVGNSERLDEELDIRVVLGFLHKSAFFIPQRNSIQIRY